MIAQYAIAAAVAALAGSAALIGYSYSIDSQAQRLQSDTARRLPVIADMIANPSYA